MEIAINLDKEDWVKSQSLIKKELLNASISARKTYRKIGVLWAVATFLFLTLLNSTDKFDWTIAILETSIIVLIIIFFVIIINNLVKMLPPNGGCVFIGRHYFDIDEHGIKVKGNGYEAKYMWEIVTQVIRKNGLILVFIENTSAFVFPEDKLENPDKFYNYINEHYKKI